MAGAAGDAADPWPDVLVVATCGRLPVWLDDLAELFHAETKVDPRSTVSPAVWAELHEAWAARHVFTHCDGMVDAKYCAAVPQTSLKVGQRLRITERESRSTVANAETLCRALAAGCQ